MNSKIALPLSSVIKRLNFEVNSLHVPTEQINELALFAVLELLRPPKAHATEKSGRESSFTNPHLMRRLPK